jgi:acyl-coenzyme A synthetase/AMP-(fatty) acid ligase
MNDSTLFTEPIEAVVNTHPSIYRSALVPRGQAPNQQAVVIVEPWPQHRQSVLRNLPNQQQAWRELLQTAHPNTNIDEFIVYPTKLPTDIRHNSKIFREQLTEWLRRIPPDTKYS